MNEESDRTVRPPRLHELGTDLTRLTTWQKIRAISGPFLACSAYWYFAAADDWTGAVVSLMVLSFVTYGSTSHDLVHGSLGLGRRWNHLLLSIVEVMSLRSGHAYQAAHLNHHVRFPHDDDIEAAAARMSLPRALLEGIVFQWRIYWWALQHPGAKRGWIIGEGIVVLVFVGGALVAWPWTVVPTVYVGLMIAGSWTIPLITSYIPHDASAPDVLHQTRVFRGLMVRIVAFDHLYHLEHHLYPGVPHQNWPRLAKRLDPWLKSTGIIPVRLPFLRE